MTGLDIRIVERALQFKTPAGTSRGVLTEKPSFYVVARDLEEDGRVGIGECSLIPGLSPESEMRARLELKKLAASGALDPKSMSLQYPAVRFAAETALID
ncbi:MAG: o-succinylbenzoate synthase, partial [Bacteroidota bacterium]|nr:o-succinylbenzoate synthase [Bacteroidota bacterium]